MNSIFESSSHTINLYENPYRRSYLFVTDEGWSNAFVVCRFGNIRLCKAEYVPLKKICNITLDSEDLPSERQSIEVDFVLQNADYAYSFRHGGLYIDPELGFNVNPYSKSGYYNSNARDSSTITSTGLILLNQWFIYYV